MPGFSGPSPISWEGIAAFLDRSGACLAPWEIEIIERIDDIYLRPVAAAQVNPPKGKTVIASSSSRDAVGVRGVLGAIGVRRLVIRKKP